MPDSCSPGLGTRRTKQRCGGNGQIRAAGLSDRARIIRSDYRDIKPDKYDKITCLEMAEHVGIKNFLKFMKQISSLLKDDGLFYLQIAGLRARTGMFSGLNMEDIIWGLFMSKYIFSGADASMPLSFVFPPAFMREARIRVSAEWRQDDLVAVRDLVDRGKLSLDGLISHRADAPEATEAYRTAFDDPSCLKMVLDWRAYA